MATENNAAGVICDGRKRFAQDGGAMNRAAAWAAALSDLALPGTGVFIAANLKNSVVGMARGR